MISLIIKETRLQGRILYTVLLVISSSVVLISEYLNTQYNTAINLLTNDCNPTEGLKIVSKIEKIDIFNNYKKSILVFKLLSYRDLNEFDSILKLLEKSTIKPFKSSYDLLLIYYYSLFLSYIHFNDKRKVKDYYKLCMNLKDKGTGKHKIVPILSWNEIDGVYHMYQKNFKASEKAFKKVNYTHMNSREQYIHFMNLSLLAIETKNFDDAKKHLTNIINGTNNLCMKNLAYELCNSTNVKLEVIR